MADQYDTAQIGALRDALHPDVKRERRLARARRTRAQALSPLRLGFRVACTPIVATSMALSIYVATSPFNKEDALRHLVAMVDCDTAMSMGVPYAQQGEPGYHPRHDADGNGVACDYGLSLATAPTITTAPTIPEESAQTGRQISGPRFVTP